MIDYEQGVEETLPLKKKSRTSQGCGFFLRGLFMSEIYSYFKPADEHTDVFSLGDTVKCRHSRAPARDSSNMNNHAESAMELLKWTPS